MLLAIIIVNFRTPARTIDCLRTIQSELHKLPASGVFVVENGSGDDSEKQIHDAIEGSRWGEWCTLIVSPRNLGFAGGNNYALESIARAGGANYLLLLNSDTLLHPGCLPYCLAQMENDASIGALSCRLLNSDGTIQNTCRRFPTPLRCLIGATGLPWRLPKLFAWADCEDLGWDRNNTARDVEWLGGAFTMLRGEWVARHGLLDDRFFFYGEDIELCHRVWRSGMRCHYNPTVSITHLGGSSSDPSRMATDTRAFHQWRGRYLVQQLCYGILARFFVQSIDILTALRRLFWRRFLRKNNSSTRELQELLNFLARNWKAWGIHGG